MNISELQGTALDEWVAKAKGQETFRGEDGALYYQPGHNLAPRQWRPSHFWSQGGPLLEDKRIDLNWDTEGNQQWAASCEPDILAQGASLLEAAMRAYVAAHFGEDLPE